MAEYKTKEQKISFYQSREWKLLRLQILERDNNECQECKRNGLVLIKEMKPDKQKTLDVDHIKEIYTHPELAFDPSNLEALCIRCHNKKHKRFYFKKKKNKWEKDEKW